MTRLARMSGMGVLLLLVSSCSTYYYSDWDTGNDFSGYQTYAWYELPEQPGRGAPPPIPNAIVAGRIRAAVQGDLDSKGLRPDTAAEADLLVTYHIALRHGVRVYSSGWGYPYHGCCGWGYGWGGGFGSARTYTEGTLIIDVLDGSARRLVWRGIADGAFKRPNPSDEEVAKVVARVMRSFPPG